MKECNYFPDSQTLPRIETYFVSGGDSGMRLVGNSGDFANTMFRMSSHGASPSTAAGLACLRNEERHRGVCGEIVHVGKTVWRPASDTGGLLACRIISATSILISVIQAQQLPAQAHLLVTNSLKELPDMTERVVISDLEKLRLFLDLPTLMREDWKGAKFGLKHNASPHDAIRQNPQFFGFMHDIDDDVGQILTDLAKYHPESYLYDPK